MKMSNSKNKATQYEAKKFVIIQTQPEVGEVPLTKPDIYENIAASFKRFQFIEIPYIRIVEHNEWKKKRKKDRLKQKKALQPQ